MKHNILLILSVVFLQGCDNTNEIDRGGYVNSSGGSKERQMTEALNSLPSDENISSYRHFHISAELEDEQRMILNLYETLSNPEHKVVSIGCESMDSCKNVVLSSLNMMSEQAADRSDLVVMLPSFISLPQQNLQPSDIAIKQYEINDPLDF